MLIYTVSEKRLIGCNNQCGETSKLKSLKLITKTLSESRMSDSNSESAFLIDNSFKNEDAEAYYITLIKHLLRSIDPHTLCTFYNTSRKAFIIFKPLLKYSHHSDIMIKNAARISLMTIMKNYQNEAMDHVIETITSKHVNDLIFHLKQITLDIQHFYEKLNATAMKEVYLCYNEELEYVDDILRLNPHNSKNLTISRLLTDFIGPFILTAVIDEKQHISPISQTVGLYLLSKLLQIITDFKMKECIIRIILQENESRVRIVTGGKQIIKSLQFILQERKTSIDTLYILYIFHILQIHIAERGGRNLENFYYNILHSLVKLLQINSYFSPHMECLKLKLLILMFEPLILKTTAYDAGWLKLQKQFSQTIEFLYIDVCKEIEYKITDLVEVIDEEYEMFINMTLDISRLFNDVNYLFEDRKDIGNKANFTKTVLYHLFCVRYLYLVFKNEKEKILPLMKMREKIGKTMFTDDCILCRKLVYGNFYIKKHFLKLTDRQLLILQNTENEEQGIVIFNCYYKDISWSTNPNNTIKIWGTTKYVLHQSKNSSNLHFIQLSFDNSDDLQLLTDTLRKAKLNQIKIISKKLTALFCVTLSENFEMKGTKK